MDFFILDIIHPGLGDNLWHSHLPRIAKESGKYNKFYLSRRSLQYFHDPSTYFVYSSNPYFDGLHDGEGRPQPSITDFGALNPTREVNVMDKIMLYYGLDDGKRGHEPELFYKPKIEQRVVGKVLYDPNYFSGVGNLTSKKVETWMRENNLMADYQIAFRQHQVALNDVPTIKTTTIEEWCDVIMSCKHFICLTSGSGVMANALKVHSYNLRGSDKNENHIKGFALDKYHTYVTL